MVTHFSVYKKPEWLRSVTPVLLTALFLSLRHTGRSGPRKIPHPQSTVSAAVPPPVRSSFLFPCRPSFLGREAHVLAGLSVSTPCIHIIFERLFYYCRIVSRPEIFSRFLFQATVRIQDDSIKQSQHIRRQTIQCFANKYPHLILMHTPSKPIRHRITSSQPIFSKTML